MLRLDKIIKPWRDAGSLNANVNDLVKSRMSSASKSPSFSTALSVTMSSTMVYTFTAFKQPPSPTGGR